MRIRLHNKLKALELLGKHLGMFGPKAPEVSPGIEIDAENIRARMLAKLRQAQEASCNTSGGHRQRISWTQGHPLILLTTRFTAQLARAKPQADL